MVLSEPREGSTLKEPDSSSSTRKLIARVWFSAYESQPAASWREYTLWMRRAGCAMNEKERGGEGRKLWMRGGGGAPHAVEGAVRLPAALDVRREARRNLRIG